MEKLGRLAVSDEGFVFDPMTGDSFIMNRTGTTILRGLQQGHDDERLIDELATEFDVTADVAARDVADFVDRLKLMHLM